MKDTRDGGKGWGGEMIVHEIVCKTEQWEEELNVKNISGNIRTMAKMCVCTNVGVKMVELVLGCA